MKKSPAKKILRVLGIVAAVVVVVVAGIFVFLDSIIKNAIEQGAPAAIGCKATVEKISVKPFSGRVLVKNLKIASPPGYEEPEMFAIDEFRVKVSVGSVLKKSGPILVNEVIIHGPKIAYEVVNGKSNFETVMARFPQSDKPEKEKPKDDKGPGRKVIIDLVEFKDGQVNVRAGYTLGQTIPLPLPSLTLRDIGRASGGVTAVQAMAHVLGNLASVITNLVTDSMKFITDQASNLAKGAAEAGKAVLDAGKDAGKAVLDAGKDAGKAVLETGKDAVKGLRDLF
jgi:hypothetical protein